MDYSGGFASAFGSFAPSPTVPFKYVRLQVNQFRLLEIEPAPFQPVIGALGWGPFGPVPVAPNIPSSAPISIRLAPLPFDDNAPLFVALSYHWGSADPKTTIRCNGATIDVGPNLHAALVALRDRQARMPRSHPQQPPPRCLFWIDSLCINQADKEEKAEQVPLMNALYRRAMHVLVWLGPPGADSALALPLQTSLTL